jgi:hypothetical protein
MTGYDEVDAAIHAWADANVKELFEECAGEPARFAYLPGVRPFECFQIWVEPPIAGCIVVSAASVDTDDGSEHHHIWEGPVDRLVIMLDEATEAVRGWVNRPLQDVR